MSLPLVTVVCPVFNEEKAVPLFYERFVKAIAPMEDKVRFELLFMNNRSVDQTVPIIMALREKDPRVHLLTFSRNFGYQASITAGMRHARGDAIVNIDVDCEDPPEMIPQFVEKWLAGADLAYGIRAKREEFILMHWGRKLFYRVTRAVSDHDIVLDMAEFFLADKRVRDAALQTRSTFPFVRGQTGYVGFNRVGIPYTRQRRIIGETHYNLISAGRFGIAGILSSSTWPLRILAYVGVAAFALDVVAAVAALVAPAVDMAKAARAGLALLTLHLGWLVLAAGTLALYVARIYKDSLGLPLYIVDDRHSTYPRI